MYEFVLVIQYISVVVLLWESAYIFANWKIKLHSFLFFNCVATLVNNTGYLMEMLANSQEEYLRGLQLSYLGRVWIPYSLFLFMLLLCKINVKRWILIALGYFHGLTFLLVLTSEWHPLYYSSMTYVEEGLFPHIETGHGIFHTLYMGLISVYIVYGMIQLLITLKREKDAIAKQRLNYIVISIIVQSVCFFGNMLDLTGGYDITVMGYTLSTLFMYIAIFKYDLLDTLRMTKDYVVDEVSEGIIAIDNCGQIEFANRTAQTFISDIESNKESVFDILQDCIDRDAPLEVNGKIYSPNLKVIYHKGMERGRIFVLVDDTEHYRYMRELKEQKEIAEAANASKSAFLSIVSHEMRTPMNAVVGMTDLLLRDNLTEKQRKYLTNIRNSGAALVMIINDILDKSKLEAGKMEIVEELYELRPMVDDVEMIIQNRIGSKSIHLIVNIDDTIPQFLVGDALRIRQILINLMNNAVKFTESGYIQLQAIVVSESEQSYEIRFSVKDSGQGIREEDLKKLGEAFAQVDTKKNHKKEGTGLGLSISKDFIALMGGELKVESTYGKGSEFYFVIEQKKADDTEETQEAAKCAWKPEEFTAPDAKILVVDDTDINLMIVGEILSPLNMTIDTADSGEKAIEKVKQNHYHIIFMDYMMPNMDGVETTDKIRKLAAAETDSTLAEYYKTVPIIALSGDTSERTQEMFKIAGIDDFTEKPVEYERLKKILRKWLPIELIKN